MKFLKRLKELKAKKLAETKEQTQTPNAKTITNDQRISVANVVVVLIDEIGKYKQHQNKYSKDIGIAAGLDCVAEIADRCIEIDVGGDVSIFIESYTAQDTALVIDMVKKRLPNDGLAGRKTMWCIRMLSLAVIVDRYWVKN